MGYTRELVAITDAKRGVNNLGKQSHETAIVNMMGFEVAGRDGILK